MKSVTVLVAVIASAFVLTGSASAEKKSGTTVDKKYPYVQINRFDVQQGLDFPPDYQLTIVEDLNKELTKIKGVQQVLREGEAPPPNQSVLVVTGTITKFKKGNQAARYLVGFGAGATVINAHIKCYDATTKEPLLEEDVDGKVIMGLMGGKSEGANNGLAKEIAKHLKKALLLTRSAESSASRFGATQSPAEEPPTPAVRPRIIPLSELRPMLHRRMAVRPELHETVRIRIIQPSLTQVIERRHRRLLRIGYQPVNRLLPVHVSLVFKMPADGIPRRRQHKPRN
jgi:hypothetical protein